MNTFGQSQAKQSYGLGSENQTQTFGQENNNSTQWGLNNTPLTQNNNNMLSGNLFGNNNLFNQNQSVWNKNKYQTQTPSRYNLKDLTDRLQQYQNNALGNSNSSLNSGLNNGSIFSPNNMQSLNLNVSSALYPQQNSFSTYSQPYQLAQNSLPNSGSDVASNNIDYSLYGNGFTKEFINEMLNNKEYQRYAIPNEGGYVNDPQDPGGETKFGISKRYHPNEDIKNLTRERANALLYKEIWNWNGINTLPSEIIGVVFDHGIRTSPQNAIETTHRALGIDPIGDIIGKTTLSRLKNMDYNEFLHKYKELVKEQDKQRSGYGRFGTGWDNRTEGYHISN